MYYTGPSTRFEVNEVPVIYADIVFLVNLMMDGAILVATCWIVRRQIRPWRLTVGLVFAALYGLLMFVPHGYLFTTWIGKALASFTMALIAIPFRSLLDLARNVLVLYCVTFLVAGAVLAMHFAVPAMTLSQGTIVHGGRLAFTTSVGGLAVVIAIPLALWLLHHSIGTVRRLRRSAESLCHATAVLNGKSVDFTGLLDTGNQLRDPLTRHPVCLVDASIWLQIVPDSFATLLLHGDDLVAGLTELQLGPDMPRLSLVPYRGVGGVGRITVAIRPDSFTLRLTDGEVRSAGPCLLALHVTPLSGDHRFQAVLHTEIMAGDDRYEEDSAHESTQHEATHSTATALDSDSP